MTASEQKRRPDRFQVAAGAVVLVGIAIIAVLLLDRLDDIEERIDRAARDPEEVYAEEMQRLEEEVENGGVH